jgi:hypothetical protein
VGRTRNRGLGGPSSPSGARRRRLGAAALALDLGILVTVGGTPGIALGGPGNGTGNARHAVHPIFVNVPDAPQDDLARDRFDRAAQRFGLGPVEVVVIDAPKVPEVAERLKTGIGLVTRLDFGRGLATLDEVAADVAASGGAGLDSRALADLYFHRGWAMSRVDFNPAHVPESSARAQGYADLERAAGLDSHRMVNPTQFPALLAEDWARAVASVRDRDREQATVVVHAAPEAFVTLDGGNPVRGPATFVGVSSGEHLIHVDEPTFAPWGATITTGRGVLDVSIPERRALTLPDAEAAARARRMGMTYALVAEPRPGQGGLSLDLRLVDQGGARRDSAIARLAGDEGALDAAVMRLDEQARRLELGEPPGARTAATSVPGGLPRPLAPVSGVDPPSALPAPVLIAPAPPRPGLQNDPVGWARDHVPLVAAVGVLLATTIILSIGVASSH